MDHQISRPTAAERVLLFNQKYHKKEAPTPEPEQPPVIVDEELTELVKTINAEGKLYFVRKDGTVTNEPWYVKVIVPQVSVGKDGQEEKRFNIVVYPMSKPDALEVYELGDFFVNRWVPRSEKEKLARKYYRGELPSYEEFQRLVDTLEPEEELIQVD